MARSRSRWQNVALVSIVLLVEGVYVWYASAGYWDYWPPGSAYYDLLADGFLHGRTSLVLQPDPRLLDLEDPYSMEEREDIPILWDASYFKGEYFLYWGPAPAAFLALPKALTGRTIPDQYLTFIAVSVVLAASTMILVFLWERFFSGRLPFWLLLAGVLLVGLSLPALWMLGSPYVYEAAVSSGMAFFLLGLFAALPSVVSDNYSRPRLAMTGLLLALALASRLTLGAVVLALCGILALRLFRRRRSWTGFALDIASLFAPLVVCGFLLGAYNFDRFGDPLETGFRFQLTGRDDTWQDVFDIRYLIPNAYNHLFRSIRWLSVFPFIKPIIGVEAVPYFPVNWHPPMYTAQLTTGLFVAAPATFFAVFLAWWILCGRTCVRGHHASDRQLRVTAAALFALAAVAFIPVGAYHWSANRFQMDFAPLVTLLAVIGAWVATARYSSPPHASWIARGAVTLTFAAQVVVALLLAVSGDKLRFEIENPELFEWITRLLA